MSTDPARNVVLVHGGFVDGSGWQGVHELLRGRRLPGRRRTAPDPVAGAGRRLTRQVIDTLDGPVVLAGHSYGGAVITEAGLHDKVAALVYVAAFAPDKGESVNTLIAGFPADGPQPPILPPVDGFLFLDRDRFHVPSPATCPPRRPRSWPTPRSPGG